MSSSKRSRACDACHSIKIRCELGSGGGSPPCERCVRLGKECLVTPPKRQKDRVAELEAQVEALTKLLATQRIQRSDDSAAETTTSPQSAVTTPSVLAIDASTKKRRLDEPLASSEGHLDQDQDAQPAGQSISISDLDAVISRQTQIEVLRKYIDSMPFHLDPVIQDHSYDVLRGKHPILLAAIIYAAGPGSLSNGENESLASLVIDGLSVSIVQNGQKSIELLQALQIVALWWRTPRRHSSITPIQMMALVPRLGRDLGLCESIDLQVAGRQNGQGFCAVDGWRSWIVCYVIAASFSFQLRRKDFLVEWGPHEEAACFMLEYNGSQSDRLLGQCVRGERMCEQITDKSGAYDTATVVDICDLPTQRTLQMVKNLVTDWKIQRPSSLNCPLLDLWEHAAMLIAHESVLHTETNKSSFCAPYIAERLSASDFATPVVTSQHVAYIIRLRDSSHAMINIFTRLEPDLLINLPAAMFATKPIHAQWILIKLYIALTGPGNTYGLFVDPATLQVHSYLHRMDLLAQRLELTDANSVTAKIFRSTSRIKDWLSTYENTHVNQILDLEDQDTLSPTENFLHLDWSLFPLNDLDWSLQNSDDNIFGVGERLNGSVDPQYTVPEPMLPSSRTGLR